MVWQKYGNDGPKQVKFWADTQNTIPAAAGQNT